MVHSISDDHWDFLEDIEAPMWADLTLENKASDLEVDDDWFHGSHFFHQCSSLQLKSTLFHPVEGSKDADLDFQKSPSIKLPSSVSKSRGKQYRCNKWGENFTLNKQHPVKGLTRQSSRIGSNSGEVVTLQSSITSSNGSSSTRTGLVNEYSSACSGKPNDLKPISTHGYSGGSLIDRVDGGNPGSTVTSERFQQQQPKTLGITTQTYAHTGGLLSVMRASLRKSFPTRQASRVEINKDRVQQRGRNSSAGKSSVGSTSTDRVIQKEKKTPDSMNFSRMTQTATSKVKVSDASNKFHNQIDGAFSTNRRSIVTGKKSAHQKVAKLKVQNDKFRPKAAVTVKVSEQLPSSAAAKQKDKSGISQIKGLAGAGRENVRERMAVSQKCKSRDITARPLAKARKGSERNVLKTSDKFVSVYSKGKIRDGNPRKILASGNQMVHLR